MHLVETEAVQWIEPLVPKVIRSLSHRLCHSFVASLSPNRWITSAGATACDLAAHAWQRATFVRLCYRLRAPLKDDGLTEIPSPCIGICRLERESGLCTGCMRTAEEIAAWPYADNAERLAIVQRLRLRRREAGRTSAADSRPRRRQPSAGKA